MATAETTLTAGQLAKMANPRPYSFAGYVIVLITFGILGTWSYFAIIASAVVASGVVSLENDRKVVQHLEGGIVQEILVREADVVQVGDPLLILDNIEVRSNIAVLEQRKAVSEAVIARLLAEQTFAEAIEFPAELKASDNPQIKSVINTQSNIFADRRSIFMSQTEILESRAEQMNGQAEGNEVQLAALTKRLDLRTELMGRMRTGEEMGVIETNRLSEMQDGVIQIEASIGEAMSEIAQVKAAAGEAKLNILKLKQEYSERANTEFKNERAELAEIDERLNIARDRMRRTSILSPATHFIRQAVVINFDARQIIRWLIGVGLRDHICRDRLYLAQNNVRKLGLEGRKTNFCFKTRMHVIHVHWRDAGVNQQCFITGHNFHQYFA